MACSLARRSAERHRITVSSVSGRRTSLTAPATGTTTLYNAGFADVYMNGSTNETVFVGGVYMYGGTADASRSMEVGVRAVGVDMDLNQRFDECGRSGLSGICSFSVRYEDAIVVHDLALFLQAQDLIEIDAGNGSEG
jgi:hypothetical protein